MGIPCPSLSCLLGSSIGKSSSAAKHRVTGLLSRPRGTKEMQHLTVGPRISAPEETKSPQGPQGSHSALVTGGKETLKLFSANFLPCRGCLPFFPFLKWKQ